MSDLYLLRQAKRSEPDDIPPLCECGCGDRVWSRKYGIWSRWRPGHAYKRREPRLEIVREEADHCPNMP
jgi:hypothetical protein